MSPSLPAARDGGGPPSTIFRLNTPEFETLRALIYARAGISLAPTKRVLLESRLSKRLRALRLDSFAAYCRYLERAVEREIVPLINCVTTNKTDFFREPHHFDFLREQALPACEAGARIGGPRRLRIWSAGCSTGEEAYSIAMTVLDWLGHRRGWDIRILASDIDTNVLDAAAAGCYPADRLADAPPESRARWFRHAAGRPGWLEADPALRELITFRRLNLNEQPWPIRTTFDIIFCRNVIIYFNRETQAQLLHRFASLLAPGGHLIVGHSETLAWLSDTFSNVRGRPTVYTLNADRPASRTLPLPVQSAGTTAEPAGSIAGGEPPANPDPLDGGDIRIATAPRTVRAVVGTSLAALIFDPIREIGGAAHFVASSPDLAGDPTAQDGECSMEVLLRRVVAAGADRTELRAKLFGGNVPPAPADATATDASHLAEAREFLGRERIPVVSECVGGGLRREVLLFLTSGRALVRNLPDEVGPGSLPHESVPSEPVP
jgi:chemotaxis protein methyltransferase CheR